LCYIDEFANRIFFAVEMSYICCRLLVLVVYDVSLELFETVKLSSSDVYAAHFYVYFDVICAV
jgi:hypothetical protein